MNTRARRIFFKLLIFGTPLLVFFQNCSSKNQLAEDSSVSFMNTHVAENIKKDSCVIFEGKNQEVLLNGESRIAYLEYSVPANSFRGCVEQIRVCKDGELSGTYPASFCHIETDESKTNLKTKQW